VIFTEVAISNSYQLLMRCPLESLVHFNGTKKQFFHMYFEAFGTTVSIVFYSRMLHSCANRRSTVSTQDDTSMK
jgi:hypothetical protein